MPPASSRHLALLLCCWAVSAQHEATGPSPSPSPGPGPGSGPSPGCCKVKKITGPKDLSGTYYLAEEDDHSTLPSACKDNCTYVRDSGTERFCFKPSSTYSSQCKGSCGLEKKHVCSGGPAHSSDNARLCTVEAIKELDWAAVQRDLRVLMTDSKAEWPADYGHYGGLIVRLAWHTAGSYRRSDGRGGADGGRQRFEPERSWADNTNLDKARALLGPVKLKYGRGLTWGDLMVLAGNTAIEDMGGDVLGFCAGRLDDQDGADSELLGPTPAQAAFMPCMRHRICQEPLGTSTVGLIYVNPEGILPDAEGLMSAAVPSRSVPGIRDTFARMNMNDQETVALIGGGHAFGKTHGACPSPPGPSPQEDPANPWPGTCGSGKGEDAYTSGFEFPWTTNPKRWDNEYFQNILNYNWTSEIGPGNRTEWKVSPLSASPLAPSAGNTSRQHIGMLTTDLALREDQAYLDLTRLYAANRTAIDHDFMHAWYKLTTRDMGPHARCLGPLVPPPQPWQYPLPHQPADLADFTLVKAKVDTLIGTDLVIQKALVRLAWRCAATFRATDYLGGCSGARVRLSPQKDWPVNANLDLTLAKLEPIKATFGSSLSWSDLIVLSGSAALELASGLRVPFCGGRTDAETDAGASDLLQPKITGAFTDSLEQLKEAARLKGLTQQEFALLNAAGYALGDPAVGCTGLFCSRDVAMDGQPGLNNRFFRRLLTETWVEHLDPGTGWKGYKAQGSGRRMLATDLWYRNDGVLRAIAEEYSSDNDKFVRDAVMAWGKLMIADRFDGPAGNLCRP